MNDEIRRPFSLDAILTLCGDGELMGQFADDHREQIGA